MKTKRWLRIVIVLSILLITAVLAYTIRTAAEEKSVTSRALNPYHIKIFVGQQDGYKTVYGIILEDYLKGELNRGYVLKEINDIYQTTPPTSQYKGYIRVLTEYNPNAAKKHPAYGENDKDSQNFKQKAAKKKAKKESRLRD